MAISLNGTTGITTPGITNTGAETVVDLTTTGNTILGDASGDTLTVTGGTTTFTQGTANGVAFLNGSKVLTTGSANLTFNGTTLTANTIGAFTLGGTIAGGGNQINNVVIGTTTPLAGAFTTLSASSAVSLNSTTDLDGLTRLMSGNVLRLNRADNNTYNEIKYTTSGDLFYFNQANGGSYSFNVNGTPYATLSATGLAVTGTLSATGAITSTLAYTNTSDLGVVVSAGIPGINVRSASLGRTSIIQNYSSNATTDFLVGTGTSNPTTPSLRLDGATGLVTATNGLAVTGALSATGTARFGSAGAAPNDFNVITSNAGGSIYTFDNSNTTAGTSILNTYLRAYGASDVSIIMQTAAGASGQVYAFGIDNSDASSFVISGTTSLGSSNLLRLSSSGNLSGGTSGTGFSFSGSAPAGSLTLDSSGNLGLGVTPTAWSAGGRIIELGTKGNILYGVSYTFGFSNNAYYDATSPSGWKFADPTSSKAGYYEQSQGAHSWARSTTAGTTGNAITFTESMVLDASGKLIINNVSTALDSALLTVSCTAGSGSNIPLSLRAGITSDGYGMVNFRNQAGVQGSMTCNSGSISMSGLSGITFVATQVASADANTLDDYEEGTWTPSYNGGLTGITYGTARNGLYRKIGSQVTVWFVLMTDGLTVTSSSLNIAGLPFTAINTAGSQGTLNINNATRWTSSPPTTGTVEPNTTVITLYNSIGATGSGVDPVSVTTSEMSTGSGNRNVLYATATYIAA